LRSKREDRRERNMIKKENTCTCTRRGGDRQRRRQGRKRERERERERERGREGIDRRNKQANNVTKIGVRTC